MTTRSEIEQALDRYLAEGAERVPDRVIDAALDQIDQIPQRRALRVPWRFHEMPSVFKFALAGAAVVAVLVVGSMFLVRGPTPNVGGPGMAPASPTSPASPSPSPVPSPTSNPLLDTSTWTTYVSDRYGFTIAYPSDWTEDGPPDHDWTFENDIEAWQSTATEHFLNPEGSVGVSAWSVAVDPGTTVESWIEAYCSRQSGGSCGGITDRAVPVETGDGHPGVGQFGPNADTMAFFLVGDRVYVAALWRGETDPTVVRYGGAWRLLETFVSTMTIGAEPPQGSPDPS
jgi:hypothetical protein